MPVLFPGTAVSVLHPCSRDRASVRVEFRCPCDIGLRPFERPCREGLEYLTACEILWRLGQYWAAWAHNRSVCGEVLCSVVHAFRATLHKRLAGSLGWQDIKCKAWRIKSPVIVCVFDKGTLGWIKHSYLYKIRRGSTTTDEILSKRSIARA